MAFLRACTYLWIGLFFLSQVSASDERRQTRTFHTDTSWDITATQPRAGWLSDPLYNVFDGTWVTPWFGGGYAIWHTTNNSRQSPERVWFRRVFTLDAFEADLERLQAGVYFDDNGRIYINGHLIVNDQGGGASGFDLELDPSLLKEGENVIAGFAWNTIHNNNAAIVNLTATKRIINGEVSNPFIEFGSEWLYLDDGSNQGTEWRQPEFDEQAWKVGQAEFGYGEGDEQTEVNFGQNPQTKHITTYFRKWFEVENASTVHELDLRIIRDDGAVVYLNGEEIYRNNLPENPHYLTRAQDALDDGIATLGVCLLPEHLVDGQNLLAVEIHQVLPESTDMSFDLELQPLYHHNVVPTLTLPLHQDFEGLPEAAQSQESIPGRLGFRTYGVYSGLERGINTRGEYMLRALQDVALIQFDRFNILENVPGTISFEFRTWEDSAATDFEANDFFKAGLRIYRHGRLDRNRPLLNLTGTALKALDRGPTGIFRRFKFDLPANATEIQLIFEARNDSGSERFFFDNISIEYDAIPFLRGRVNQDDFIEISDAITTLLYLFRGQGPLLCEDAADFDDSGEVDLADPISILTYMFLGGRPPQEPHLECGIDTTKDDLECEQATSCVSN